MKYVKQYILNWLILIDQFFMVLFGGDPDETWSSFAWKLHLNKNINWLYKFIDKLFYDGHCKASYEPEEGSKALWNI